MEDQCTVMAERRIEVDLELVLVEKLFVPRRVSTSAAALHTPEVLRPSRSSGVLLQPLLFRSSIKLKIEDFQL